ncbi:PREDICTED: thioredoxin-like 3-2, chloroplastic [Nelumbo nucifera]|uniref:Thioredoxin-like 3-2, chloroplastic n=2 Tax=Nelumbo nucifera TaxID=4432 RepID=A0A1U7ZXR8_NELNU|nr:PREDICTED: thioredoxin-like 3-2, chloroplastic [Nelumbo nucifera]DAD26778.1 TPA_asm: hypothetical protein HUJ06_028246 [Nelumbo nucifera]
MSGTLSISPCIQSSQLRKPYESSSGHVRFLHHFSISETEIAAFTKFSLGLPDMTNKFERKITMPTVWTAEGPLQEDLDAPVSIQLQPIVSEEQFDQIIAEAQQLEESVIIVWMASWCRKFIYLKPKLEKLAAYYHSRIRFYCVDVNIIPYRLVAHAGITKMPTIQLWKDSKKQAEVFGGHKAHLVVSDVHEIIENELDINFAV